jgi:hypothetical protein
MQLIVDSHRCHQFIRSQLDQLLKFISGVNKICPLRSLCECYCIKKLSERVHMVNVVTADE